MVWPVVARDGSTINKGTKRGRGGNGGIAPCCHGSNTQMPREIKRKEGGLLTRDGDGGDAADGARSWR